MRTRKTTLLLVKASLISAAHRAMHTEPGQALRGLQVEALRELELSALAARTVSDREGSGMTFGELCDALAVSPGRVSSLTVELQQAGLVHVVRRRGRHRQVFRITPAGIAAVHQHYERVLAALAAQDDPTARRTLRWLLRDLG